ncbi:MAG: Na+/H+ antiporter NhaC family protein [Lachnospiraceae bacterium]
MKVHISETAVLIVFAVTLIGSIMAGIPILAALVIGYLIFFAYSLNCGYSAKDIFAMSWKGIKTAKNILLTFLFIGMLTALWRAAGTIPAIVSYCAGLMNPAVMILMAFLLNCLVSVLTGTAFGTAATMGVICMTMAKAVGCNEILAGGAILSGVFFGDRCSPVSTSALLVAELTHTNIFDNIRLMVKTTILPLILTCVFYGVCGIVFPAAGSGNLSLAESFSSVFRLGLIPILPAVVIMVLSLFRVQVRKAMLASIVTALGVCLFWQHTDPSLIVGILVGGYKSPDPAISSMIDGGGIMSMVRVALIITISSSYSGIFEETGLLNGLKSKMGTVSRKITPFGTILMTSVAAGMVACNQTLATMLVDQICKELEPDPQKFAIDMENSVIVVAPLVPWSIAGAVPLASVSAPLTSIVAAVFLYLLPLWHFGVRLRKK